MTQPLFYKNIYLRSLTPFEVLKFRRENDFYENRIDDNQYIDFWRQCLDKNSSSEVFEKYCFANNLSDLDVIMMTSQISKFGNDVKLPIWVEYLKDVLDCVIIKTDNNGEKPFYQLLSPFVDFFSRKLIDKLTSSNITIPKKEVVNQLNTTLFNDLFEITYRVLLIEFDKFKSNEEVHCQKSNDIDFFYKRFVTHILKNNFYDLFLSYPMLARKIMTKTYRHLDFVFKMLERLEFDVNEIELYFDLTLRNIESLEMNLGDQHNGESTVIIEFENTNKVVYKPTNNSITNAYNHFINWINVNLDENLKTFKIIDKETYGWIEFVNHLECNSIDDVKCYYQRAGILLGVAHFLNAKDVHFENIIAHGNSPVIIDHETILSPILKKLYKGKEGSKCDFSGTILETNLLPIKEINLPHYIYGFGSSIQLESNFTVLKLKNPNQDNMLIIPEDQIKKLYKFNKPLLNQKIENLIDYQLEFIIGFKKLYELIIKSKVHLLSTNSPIVNFFDLQIRFINRPTKVYNKILNILNRPEYLKDSIKYGLILDLLARVYASSNNWSPILDYEREQMLQNDIPVFYMNTTDNIIKLSDDKNIDIIQKNAIESIYNKIKNACLEDFNNQIKLISDSIKL